MPTLLARTAALCLLITSLVTAREELQLTLPPRWFGVPGVPVSLYFDNVVLTEKPEAYRFEVACDIGHSEARHWTTTPAITDVGDHTMVVTVKDAKGTLVADGKTVLRIAPADAGAGRELKLLVVGDSLTHASLYPNEIARLLSQPGNPKATLLGTHRPTAAAPGVVHEGYGGWTWERFLTKWQPNPKSQELKYRSSPFLFAGAGGKGTLDLPRYFREGCQGQTPDVVTFLLGINDCFGAKADDAKALDKHIDTTLDQAEKLISAMRAACPQAVLAVGLTTPPNARQAAFTANYGDKYTRWGWKRIQHRLVQRMLARLGERTQDRIFLVPTELNLDPVDGYPENNGVHPNPVGYAQIGTSFYAWLKAWLATTAEGGHTAP